MLRIVLPPELAESGGVTIAKILFLPEYVDSSRT
jgi:hypothetical protein